MARYAERAAQWADLSRRRAGSAVFDNMFRLLAYFGSLHPGLQLERFDLQAIRDIAYRRSGRESHLLDVIRPRKLTEPRPVVLYVHGGGFRILSKDSHQGAALQFARRGYVVVNINYRLAPRHPYPAAIADTCRAYQWVVENISTFGGDPSRIAVAGESAGANLATGVAVAACYDRPEPWARRVREARHHPRAVLPTCGILQVSDAERFDRRKNLPWFISDHLEQVERDYLPDGHRPRESPSLADPLRILERQEPDRRLPPFYTCVGTKDPLLDDTRRLEAALQSHGTPCWTTYAPGQPHAYHCAFWTTAAIRAWREKFDFLERAFSDSTRDN